MPKPTKLVQIAKNALEDLKGSDIKVLDVAHLTTVTDWMLICTGTSTRHVKSLADNVADTAREAGFRPLGTEGADGSDWVLVDLGSVVVHVMQAQARIHYQLEKLWDIAPPEEPEEAKPKKAAAKPKLAATPKTPGKPKASKKPAAKKPAAARAPAKKVAAKKPAAKKPAPGKTAAKKPAVKKAPAKKK